MEIGAAVQASCGALTNQKQTALGIRSEIFKSLRFQVEQCFGSLAGAILHGAIVAARPPSVVERVFRRGGRQAHWL